MMNANGTAESKAERSAQRRQSLRRILRYIHRYQGLLIISLVLALLSVAATLYIPLIIGRAIDCIIAERNVDLPEVVRLLTRVCVLAGLTAAAQWIMNTVNNRLTYSVVRDVRREAFGHLQELPLSYLDGHSVGDIVSRVISDADQLADGLLMGFASLFTGVMTIIGTLIFMVSVHPLIALAVVVLTPISLFTASFISRRTYSMFEAQTKARGAQTAYIDEMISGQKVVHAFSREQETMSRFEELNDELGKRSLKAVFFSSLVNPTTRFVNSVVYTAVALTGALAVLSGSGMHSMTVGMLSCFLSYANQYTKPFNEISGVVTELQNAFACAARLFELIDCPPQEPDRENTVSLGTDIDGGFGFDGVSFSYTPDRPLIKGFSLDVKPGQRVVIVGPTGCGKTTLINLIMRFYEINGGRICLDGTDTRDISRASLRSAFGMVLQDTWLKTGTIRDNIRLGDPDATDEDVEQAARTARAHGFISRMPEGYDTVVSEDGGMLSQGQKQLLCITRVMLSRPSMLILDEATSSIDTRTEMKIQEAFGRLTEGHTSFIVAHRLSTIRNADVILVMNDGDIIEQGTHDDLLAVDGFYAKLYRSQYEGQ